MPQLALKGCHIMVVEDDFFQAHFLINALRTAGATTSGPCASEMDACEQVLQRRPDAAVLDVNLGSGPTFRLADALGSDGIPFVFLTGYGQNVVPARLRGVPFFEKPTDPDRIVDAIVALLASNS